MARRPIVVLCDPFPPTRELLERVFADEVGTRVAVVDDAKSALHMVDEVRADLVVIELDARRMGDLDLVQRIKEAKAGLPVVALTAWGQMLSCAQALEAGCDACFAKPFDVDELIDRAQALLRRSGV